MVGDSETTRILLFGPTGQLGHELLRFLDPLGEVVAAERSVADFRDPESLRQILQNTHPSVVVNAAAYTGVDKAESEPEIAMTINAIAPRVIAEEADAMHACMVHYSTDFIFDGSRSQPYTETSDPAPLSAYGRSKLAGETAVAKSCRRHLIFRTSWVYGRHGNNFLKAVLRMAAERDSLEIVADQRGTPTAAEMVASNTAKILQTMVSLSEEDARWGIYNLVAAGSTSWFEYARFVVDRAAAYGIKLTTIADAVRPIATSDYPTAATRPPYSVLATDKIVDTFGIALPSWRDEVDSVLQQLASH